MQTQGAERFDSAPFYYALMPLPHTASKAGECDRFITLVSGENNVLDYFTLPRVPMCADSSMLTEDCGIVTYYMLLK